MCVCVCVLPYIGALSVFVWIKPAGFKRGEEGMGETGGERRRVCAGLLLDDLKWLLLAAVYFRTPLMCPEITQNLVLTFGSRYESTPLSTNTLGAGMITVAKSSSCNSTLSLH